MAALLCALAVLSYAPALRGGLLWDDDAHLTRPELRSWSGLGRIWTDLGATQQYYPVLHSAFWLEQRAWRDATLPYHVLNVGLHAAASLLLVAALRRLWAEGRAQGHGVPSGAEWLAGFIFAVHPVAVESVAWISEQKNTLSLVFYLGAGLAYLRFDRTRSFVAYAAAFALYALALGTKTVTASLPAALLVVLWWQRGTLSWRRDVLPLAPWLAFGVGAGLFTAWVERTLLGADGADFAVAWWQRGLLAARVIGFYVGKLVWPANLTFIYPRWDAAGSALRWVPWLLGVIAVTFAAWRVRRRNRGLLAGWLFFVGSLFPALGFVNVYPFRFSYVADHFQYLPSVGLIALAAAALGLAWQRLGFRTSATATAVVLVPALALLAHHQARDYRDVETLFRATLARNSACWMAHLNLGVELAKTPERKREAIAHFRAALALRPTLAEAHYNLANELTRLGEGGAEVIEHYTRALELKPDYAEAHNNLAMELQKSPGREQDAIAHFESALRINPANARAHNNLGFLLKTLPGRLPDAVAHYERALEVQPDLVVARVNLATALSAFSNRAADAEAEFNRALQLQPSAEAHYGLGNLLIQQRGRDAEALHHYQEALRLRPDYADVHYNLGVFHARQGRHEEAARAWTRALELDGTLVQARRNLELLRGHAQSRIQSNR